MNRPNAAPPHPVTLTTFHPPSIMHLPLRLLPLLLFLALPKAHAQIISTNLAAPISLYYEQKIGYCSSIMGGFAMGGAVDMTLPYSSPILFQTGPAYVPSSFLSTASATLTFPFYISAPPDHAANLQGFFVGPYSRITYGQFNDVTERASNGFFGGSYYKPNGKIDTYLHLAAGCTIGYAKTFRYNIHVGVGMGIGFGVAFDLKPQTSELPPPPALLDTRATDAGRLCAQTLERHPPEKKLLNPAPSLPAANCYGPIRKPSEIGTK